MRTYPDFVNASTVVSVLQNILGNRREDITDHEGLRDGKLKGRNRTGVRAAPSSATDTTDSDIVGDIVTDATYKYELVDVAGVLKWHRVTLSVGW
jgi:hypothetical protein